MLPGNFHNLQSTHKIFKNFILQFFSLYHIYMMATMERLNQSGEHVCPTHNACIHTQAYWTWNMYAESVDITDYRGELERDDPRNIGRELNLAIWWSSVGSPNFKLPKLLQQNFSCMAAQLQSIHVTEEMWKRPTVPGWTIPSCVLVNLYTHCLECGRTSLVWWQYFPHSAPILATFGPLIC